MKWKTRIEVKLPKKADPFKQLSRLLKEGKILRSFVCSADSIVIIYDNRKLTISDILKITGGECINEDLHELLLIEKQIIKAPLPIINKHYAEVTKQS